MSRRHELPPAAWAAFQAGACRAQRDARMDAARMARVDENPERVDRFVRQARAWHQLYLAELRAASGGAA